MSFAIDTTPPPAPTLREAVEGLEPGQSLYTEAHPLRVLRVTASRIRKTKPDRKFRSAETDGGARIWRLA